MTKEQKLIRAWTIAIIRNRKVTMRPQFTAWAVEHMDMGLSLRESQIIAQAQKDAKRN